MKKMIKNKYPTSIEDYFKFIEFLCRKFYSIYQNIYIDFAIDLDDLYQEAKLAILELFSKFKEKDITYPLVKKSVEWRLNTIRMQCIKEIRKYTPSQETICEKCNGRKKIYGVVCPFCKGTGKQTTKLWDKIFIENINDLKDNIHQKPIFNIIPKLLTDKEYKIISLHLKDKYTFKEIGEEFGKERRTIFEIYKRALKKLRKKMEIDK